MIVSSDLRVTYRWREEPVLKGTTGAFESKSLVLDPNGAGKNTFFRAVCGLPNIASQEISIDGKHVERIEAISGVPANEKDERNGRRGN